MMKDETGMKKVEDYFNNDDKTSSKKVDTYNEVESTNKINRIPRKSI